MSMIMKKLVSSLMIGLIATTATMSAMGLLDRIIVIQRHQRIILIRNQCRIRGGFHKAPPKAHFNQHDRHDKFGKKDHKGFFNKNHHNGPHHKLPPKYR
ncbi:hypothetical protein [Acinetobacter variabilis]|uniref:hypothetical protein n=1 Tax=Acinetobacter variabilis TaxID=70346 RepID=UPI001E33B0C4|nr:hypothetical protein [Acinetobacter variabilis]